MGINGVSGGYAANFAQQVSETAKTSPKEELRQREMSKTEEKRETPAQEKVEVRAKQEIEDVAKVNDESKAQQVKNDVMQMMKDAPNQAFMAQSGNLSPQRIANLL